MDAPIWSLVAVLGILMVWVFAQTRDGRSNEPPKESKPPPDRPKAAKIQGHPADPRVQMEAVSRSAFRTQAILSKEEYRLLPLLESIVRELNGGYRVTIQTSLGEIISAKAGDQDTQKRAYAAINSKRIDFGIIDRFGHLQLAVEYQGSGHHLTAAFMRDAVKREALRKAGVHMLEVERNFSTDLVKAQILKRLGPRR